MKILHVEPARCPQDLRQRLSMIGDVTYREVTNEDDLLRALGENHYEALFVRLGIPVGRQCFLVCPSLRWVVTPTTGLEHLDLTALREAEARVISLRGQRGFLQGVRSTAEHTWALLLALVRRLPAACADVAGGRWRREPFLATELQGKTLGIVGVGRLGGMVAGFGAAFHMRIVGFDCDPKAFRAAEAPVEPTRIEDLLAMSNVVSLHLPLDSATAGFLSRDRIRAMRTGALLVNTARGELVDEKALLEALRSGSLGGAALDVLQGDAAWPGGIPPEHPLIAYATRHPNLLITPHCGGYGRESIEATRGFVVEQFLSAVAGDERGAS